MLHGVRAFFVSELSRKGGMTMQGIEIFPEACRDSIMAVAEFLQTDYHSAYFAILYESVMSDLSPSDPAIPELVRQNADLMV